MLSALAEAGVSHLALEASSHGLDQQRLDGVRLSAGAFTNLTRDHLDYHHDMAAYRAAKLRLFAALLPEGAPVAFATSLEHESRAALAAIAARRRLRLFGVGEGGDAIALEQVTPRPDGQEIVIRAGGRRRTLGLALAGRFQAENALLAAALATALGLDDALDALPHLTGVRGRMERVARLANGAAIYVDYAHTPDALAQALEALRPHATGKLALVFGAGGDRDRGKRPLMGEVAAARADRVIITDDNPRSEDPALIRAAIRAACPLAAEIGDRRSAIAAALADLGPGDLLVIAGKGHEQGQIIGAETLPFDDAAVVRALVGGDA
jgi:UDP-N-acetylmuramoyl-L-alanyl-D-glutamate--2,6-diaminopimelate ligase